MRVFWKVPQQQLQIEAESAPELTMIAELVNGGPMTGAHWLRVREDDLGFARPNDEGITGLIGGRHVVVGLVWDVAGDVRQRTLLNAAEGLAQSVQQLLSLLPVQAQVDLAQASARVAAVQSDFEKKPAA